MASPPMVPAASGNQNASLSGPNMNGMKPKMVETTVRKMGVILAFQAFRYALLAVLETQLSYQVKQMAELKKELNELDPESSQVKVTKEVHRVLEEIAKAFVQAQKDNLNRFLQELEAKANEYMVALSAADFHGEVRLIHTANNSTEIKLFSSNGTEIKKPSGSQKTVMYISVLFAISDFTQEKRDEDYPLIFDAATSSFGDSKEEDFYNVIDKINKQCIIVTKDFIEKGRLNEEAIDGLTCAVYRIKKVQL